MKKLISLSIETEGENKGSLKIELTLEGASYLSENPEATLIDLFGENGKVDNYICDSGCQTIYTNQPVRYLEHPIIVDVFKYDDKQFTILDILEKDSYKGVVYFVPDKENEARQENIKCKLGVDMWAVYSPQKLDVCAIEIEKRYETLSRALESTRNAVLVFQGSSANADDKYIGMAQDLAKELEREMSYCSEKMIMLGIITNNDFTKTETVSQVYRTFRNVDESKNKEKLNVRTDEKEDVISPN